MRKSVKMFCHILTSTATFRKISPNYFSKFWAVGFTTFGTFFGVLVLVVIIHKYLRDTINRDKDKFIRVCGFCAIMGYHLTGGSPFGLVIVWRWKSNFKLAGFGERIVTYYLEFIKFLKFISNKFHKMVLFCPLECEPKVQDNPDVLT